MVTPIMSSSSAFSISVQRHICLTRHEYVIFVYETVSTRLSRGKDKWGRGIDISHVIRTSSSGAIFHFPVAWTKITICCSVMRYGTICSHYVDKISISEYRYFFNCAKWERIDFCSDSNWSLTFGKPRRAQNGADSPDNGLLLVSKEWIHF